MDTWRFKYEDQMVSILFQEFSNNGNDTVTVRFQNFCWDVVYIWWFIIYGYGYYIGNTFAGALGYADATLIESSLQSLKLVINLCEEFTKEFDIQFNISK